MKYLLDTNVCVDYLRGRHPALVERIQRTPPGNLRLCSVVVAELRYGADRSGRPKANHSHIDVLIDEIECLDFDLAAAAAYGRLRNRLESAGETIGPNDLLIAAHALSQSLVLVTDNSTSSRA